MCINIVNRYFFFACILGMIDGKSFLNHLLDIVENTRDEEDETFNYSIIHLIVRKKNFIQTLISFYFFIYYL